MTRVYIGLGSNLGNPEENLREALNMIDCKPEIKVTAVSSLYLTEPVGLENQPWFYNCVAELETELNPEEFLDILQHIENELGRVRTIRWGPRTVDLDILLYGNLTIDTERLTVPHPRMQERAFVMVPLDEIASSAQFPDGQFVGEIRRNLKNEKKYSCIRKKIW